MALDNFKKNLQRDDDLYKFEGIWDNELFRVRDEILHSFCSFLKFEGFSIERKVNSAKATYGSATIEIKIEEPQRIQGLGRTFGENILKSYITYNKWNSVDILEIDVRSTNQPITYSPPNSNLEGYYKYTKDPIALKKYIQDFKPIQYNFVAKLKNDRSKLGFFNRFMNNVTDGSDGQKGYMTFNDTRTMVEAVLNDEIIKSARW